MYKGVGTFLTYGEHQCQLSLFLFMGACWPLSSIFNSWSLSYYLPSLSLSFLPDSSRRLWSNSDPQLSGSAPVGCRAFPSSAACWLLRAQRQPTHWLCLAVFCQAVECHLRALAGPWLCHPPLATPLSIHCSACKLSQHPPDPTSGTCPSPHNRFCFQIPAAQNSKMFPVRPTTGHVLQLTEED